MIRIRPAVSCCAALLAALGVAACSSTVSGTPDRTGNGGRAAASTSVSSLPSGHATDGKQLGALIIRGSDPITSAHLEMTISAAGQQVTASADQTLAHGATKAMKLDETIPGAGALTVIIVNDALYAKLPAAMNPTDKPWVHILPNTTNPVLKPLAASLSQMQASTSLDRYSLFANAADHVTWKGRDQVSGQAADHYSLVVEVDRLPAGFPQAGTLESAGVTQIPLDLWLDTHGRVIRITEALTVAGQQSSTAMTLSNFDESVTINPPPADQVATA